MAYRNKTYISFDADTDMHWYRLMQAWTSNTNIDFNFHNVHDINPNPRLTSERSIKRQLRERFANTKNFVLLVGNRTKYLYRYVRWEIEQALNLELPIIVVNLNKKRKLDTVFCPPIIRHELAVHVSYNQAIVAYAMKDWSITHLQKKQRGESGDYYYINSIYNQLGL